MTTTKQAEPAPITPRVLISVEQLADRLGLTGKHRRKSVAGMCERGVLPNPFKLGSTKQAPLRWSLDEVDVALAALPRAKLTRANA